MAREGSKQKGLNTFYEGGNALTEIRDNKQYKDNYSTFEDYCIKRWDIKRAYAYQLIQSVKTIENLSTVVDILPETQRQTRELSKAPEEQQAEVWQTAQEETGSEQPTAKEIKQAVVQGASVQGHGVSSTE